jgi:hypothetical protein
LDLAKRERLVRQANGDLVNALLLYKARPNDDDNYVDAKQNRELAVEMAARAAKEIDLPAVQRRATG